jgi:hypothetical protein
VRVLGVPETLLHKEGFYEIGSMLGVVQEMYMARYRANIVSRIKVGVMDPSKIPNISVITDYPFVYHLRFELGHIVEYGGAIVDGGCSTVLRAQVRSIEQLGNTVTETGWLNMKMGIK